MERYEQCRQTVEEGLRQKIDLSREVSDEEVREMIDEMVIHCSRQYADSSWGVRSLMPLDVWIFYRSLWKRKK